MLVIKFLTFIRDWVSYLSPVTREIKDLVYQTRLSFLSEDVECDTPSKPIRAFDKIQSVSEIIFIIVLADGV